MIPSAVVWPSGQGTYLTLLAFNFNFHSWLEITIEFTTDWAAVSVSSFFWAVVRIETSSTKRAITASSLSEEAKSLMKNKKSKGARTEPWGRPWLKHQLEVKTLKSWTGVPHLLSKDWIQQMNIEGMQVFSMWSSSFSLQTVLHALLKSRVSIRSVSLGVVENHLQLLRLFT